MESNPVFFTNPKWELVIVMIMIKMAIITLARQMWFVDIVVEKDFKQRSNGILQILIGRSCLILEVSAVVKGM